MINSIEEKRFLEKRIMKLENILLDLKDKLLPDREEQYNAMAEIYVRKILEMREEIEEFTGMSNIIINKKDINIHIRGPIIDYGSAPISVISGYLDNFRKTIQKVYGIVNDVKLKTRVPSSIAKMTDFRLVQYAPGSINFSLSLPEKQVGFFEEENIDTALELYFDILKWLSGDFESSKRIDALDEEKLEKLLVTILKTLPDDKNITSVEFFGNKISKRIYINNRSKDKIKDTIRKIESKENLLEYRGCIRELDLDKLTFSLRNINDKEVKQLKCQLNEEIIEDIKNYFDTEVIVTGVKKGQYLFVKYMEKV